MLDLVGVLSLGTILAIVSGLLATSKRGAWVFCGLLVFLTVFLF